MSEIAFLSYLMLIIKINFKNNNEDDDRKSCTFCNVLKYGIIKKFQPPPQISLARPW